MNGIEKITSRINADVQREIDEINAQAAAEAAEIAAQYGIDMLCIDNEHYPFNPQRVEALARAAQIYGSGVVIRVPNEEAGPSWRPAS